MEEKIIQFLFRYLPFVVAVFVLVPFIWQDGYFLTVDWIYGPEVRAIPTQMYPNYTFWIAVQQLVSFIIPTTIIQKGIIIIFFIVALFSAERFLKIFFDSRILISLGMVFFILNPFVYPRLMQGQIYVLFAYALIPLLYAYLYERSYFRSLFIGGLLLTFSLHFIFFLVFIGLCFLLFFRDRGIFSFETLLGVIVFFGLNAYWIFSSTQTGNISNFDLRDLEVFRITTAHFHNIYLEVISLNGFWGDYAGRYILHTGWGYWTPFIFLSSLGIYGIYESLRNPRYEKSRQWTYFLLGLGFSSILLGVGISSEDIVASINHWIYENIPNYIGLRESGKWIALLPIVYAYFFLRGCEGILHRFGEKSIISYVTPFVVGFVIIAYTSELFFSGHGYMKTYLYPEYWKETRPYIENTLPICERKDCYTTVSFPWHSSLGFSFTRGMTIANPVGLYFGNSVLFGDNIEIGPIYSQSTRPESAMIEKYVGPNGSLFTPASFSEKEFFDDLSSYGITSILLLKEVDWERYKKTFDILEEKGQILRIFENPATIVYKIKNINN